MVEVKYKSAPFRAMGADELRLQAKGLLVKISIVTGWMIPEDETMYRILSQHFEKKLAESFPTVNPDEMELAFRTFGTQVKDWGKAMNLALIDEVMIPYLEKRAELSQLEEQKQPAVKQIEHKEDLSDKSMGEWLESVKGQVKGGKMTVEFIPVMLYDWLDKKGQLKLTPAAKRVYLAKAATYRHGKLSEEAKDFTLGPGAREALAKFNEQHERGCFEGAEADLLKNLAKRMVVFDYLKSR